MSEKRLFFWWLVGVGSCRNFLIRVWGRQKSDNCFPVNVILGDGYGEDGSVEKGFYFGVVVRVGDPFNPFY